MIGCLTGVTGPCPPLGHSGSQPLGGGQATHTQYYLVVSCREWGSYLEESIPVVKEMLLARKTVTEACREAALRCAFGCSPVLLTQNGRECPQLALWPLWCWHNNAFRSKL